MPQFSRTLPDLADAMNLYRTSIVRCMENNKIYDAVILVKSMNSQLNDVNRIIFSDLLLKVPVAEKDTVQCPKCAATFEPDPVLAIISDSIRHVRKCPKCAKLFDWLEHATTIDEDYSIYPNTPQMNDDYETMRNHRTYLYDWFAGAFLLVDRAFRNYRLNYKSETESGF